MTGKWIECETCQGNEGWMDDDKWHNCPACEGSGGHVEELAE